jgi:hypothetical protein
MFNLSSSRVAFLLVGIGLRLHGSFFFFFALSPLTPTGREKLIEAANTVNLARWRHGVPEGETGVVKEKGRGTPEVLASAPGFQLAGVKFGLVA